MNFNRETLQSAATANGNGTKVKVEGYTTHTLQILGSFTATINFEASLDGNNWSPVAFWNLAAPGLFRTTTDQAGLWRLNGLGLGFMRARISGYSSGSVTVIMGRVTGGEF